MLLVGNGTVLTLGQNNQVISHGAVLIENTRILEIGRTDELKARFPQAQFIDARGKLIMPGMINSHMHFYSTFARGMNSKSKAPKNFQDVLEGLWWKLDKLLTPEDVYFSALLPLIECVRTGTTTIIDHHASPNAVSGSLSTLARAAREVGVRGSFCYEVSDRDGEGIADQGIRENADFIAECQKNQDPMISALFGIHASFTVSDRTLAKCREVAEAYKTGFHLHVSEGQEDLRDAQSKYGMRVVERLEKWGILGPKTLAVHCIHINEREIEILRDTRTQVIHNPESNMGNAVGVAPVLEMMRQGILIGLGTDGYTCDMFESAKVANILLKHEAADPSVAWGEVPQMLYTNNPQVAHRAFGGKFGTLEPGAWADLIVVDYLPFTPFDESNWSGHLLFGVSGRAVETTIINGKVRMLRRELVDIDEEKISVEAKELATKLWQKL